MDTPILVSLLSAAVALISAGFAAISQRRLKRFEATLRREEIETERREVAERLVSRYREPLAHAAFDLQSRLYNILRQDLVGAYYARGSAREKAYVVDNTAFLIAQLFAWIEIIRIEAQFLDLGEETQTQRLGELLETIAGLWSRDDLPGSLRIFRGEQRGIGEEMIETAPDGRTCIGYSVFQRRVEHDENPFLNHLCRDLTDFARGGGTEVVRLSFLQPALIDLVDFLDPHSARFPQKRRERV